MNNFDNDYFIAFPNREVSPVYFDLALRSSNRYLAYKKYDVGEPIFVENTNDDLVSNSDFKLHDAHLCQNSLIISDNIKSKIDFIENDGVQIFPAVIINNEKYYENYWVINIYERLDLLNLSKCDIFEFEPDETSHFIDKYSLSYEKVISTPLNDRLIFVPDKSMMGYTMVHKSIIEIMEKFDIAPVKFISLDEWRVGVQFVE